MRKPKIVFCDVWDFYIYYCLGWSLKDVNKYILKEFKDNVPSVTESFHIIYKRPPKLPISFIHVGPKDKKPLFEGKIYTQGIVFLQSTRL